MGSRLSYRLEHLGSPAVPFCTFPIFGLPYCNEIVGKGYLVFKRLPGNLGPPQTLDPEPLYPAEPRHFVLEDELLRGVPLRATLWGLGKLWLTSPIDPWCELY